MPSILLLWLLCACAIVAPVLGDKKPEMQSHAAIRKVMPGGNVTFECKVANRGSFPVVWNQLDAVKDQILRILFIDQHLVSPQLKDRYILEKDSSILRIVDVKPEDNSRIQCTVPFGSVSVNHTLIVLQKPTVVPLHKEYHTTSGESLTIGCNATGIPDPEIHWVRDAPSPPELEEAGDTLSFVAESRYNGYYKCVATNEAGQSDTQVKVTVKFPPEITLGEEDDGRGGRQVTCRVLSNPEPSLSLIRASNGEQVRSSGAVGERTHGTELQMYKLTLPIRGINDYTNYTCKAENELGASNSTHQVIKNPPKPNKPEIVTKMQAKMPTDFLLEWNLESEVKIVRYSLNVSEFTRQTQKGESTTPVQKGTYVKDYHTVQVEPSRDGAKALYKGTYQFSNLKPHNLYKVILTVYNAHNMSERNEFTFTVENVTNMGVRVHIHLLAAVFSVCSLLISKIYLF